MIVILTDITVVKSVRMVGHTAAMLARTVLTCSQSCDSNSYVQPGRLLANKHHSNSLFLLPCLIVSIQHTQVRCTHSWIEASSAWSRTARHPAALSGLQVVEKGADKEGR